MLVKILSTTLPLSLYLQTQNLDLKTALETASNVQNNIQDITENCNIEFQQLFLSKMIFCEQLDITDLISYNLTLLLVCSVNVNQIPIQNIFLKSQQYSYLVCR